jgi:hypothetical protein
MSDIAVMVREAIRRDGSDSERTTQSDQYLIGPSEIGGCRAYLAHMVARTPRVEPEEDIKLAAFIGSATGDRIEASWRRIDPTVRTQVPITTTFPSGLTVSGHVDVVTTGSVVDLKSKDGLALVRRSGPTFQNKAQLQTYLLGAIQEGILPPGSTGALAYYDRSGKDDQPEVFEYALDMDIIAEIDSRLEDVIYAAEYDLDSAPRDAAYEFCQTYCLTGDTEVVTRQGIRPIRDLAREGVADLLVPSRQRETGLTWHGKFSNEKVLSFGIQPVRTITLGRGKARKVVRATPEHQWILRAEGTHTRTQRVVRTEDLSPGDVLRSIRRNQAQPEAIRVAQMQGYVFGDGTRGNAASCEVTIYNASSDVVDVLPLFAGHRTHYTDAKGTTVLGLPSLWKEAPNFDESPSYLLSWLSGYLAADGTVSTLGQVTISSARRDHIDLVRSVAAVAGVGYGPVHSKLREGFRGREPSHLYSVTLRTEVFCAVVDDVEAFALSDGLLTHNCAFFHACRGKDEHIASGLVTDEGHLAAIKAYSDALAMQREATQIKDEAKAVLAGVQGRAGDVEVTWTHVGDTTIPTYLRAGYDKISIRKAAGAKKGVKK